MASEDPHVGAGAGGVDGFGERGVPEPPEVGRAVVGQKPGRHEEEAAQVQPVGEVVEARKRHVGRADHQRDQVVAQSRERERSQEHEQHDRAVHSEQLVEHVLGHECVVGDDQLRPDAFSQQAGE
jgi:hypothetical protein